MVAAQRVIDAQAGKVVLVGHSWGGAVVTQAGASDKVKALVCVAAFALSEGEALASSGKNYPTPAGVPTLQEGPAGFVSPPGASYAANFAQHVPAATTSVLGRHTGPVPGQELRRAGDGGSVENQAELLHRGRQGTHDRPRPAA
ncbi:hypothetical protein ASD15_16020 [Massilia sp. Root351]|nr:hypothetical protein ASD15_16020 [Massilia sp. Root351]